MQVGSLEHLEQVPTVTVTFVQTTYVLATFVHIRNISAVTDLIFNKLIGRILGPSLKDAHCHGDICPGNLYVVATLVHISNISAVTDLILTKL